MFCVTVPVEVADKDEGKEENTVTEEKEEKKETKREEKQNGDVERKTEEVPEPGNRNDLACHPHFILTCSRFHLILIPADSISPHPQLIPFHPHPAADSISSSPQLIPFHPHST